MLKVNNCDVFQPEPWFRFIRNSDNGIVSVGRQEIEIHYPMKSLKSICLWEILFLLNSPNNIDELDVPNSLKNELRNVLDISSRKHFNSEMNEDEEDEEDFNS